MSPGRDPALLDSAFLQSGHRQGCRLEARELWGNKSALEQEQG